MKSLCVALGLLAALLFAASPAVAQSDTEAPVLVDFDFNPKSVDVTSGPSSVSCQISAHDAGSGVAIAWCEFVSPSFQHVTYCSGSLSSGTTHDGTWSCEAPIPQYTEPGTWSVWVVRIDDAWYNQRWYITADLAAQGFPTHLQVSSSPDSDPPTLTAFDFNPKSVDVTNGPSSFSCQISVRDSPAGVQSTTCMFLRPSGGRGVGCAGTLTSGTVHAGTWSCIADVQQYVEAGTYTVNTVDVTDSVGNTHRYGAAELAGLGFPTLLQITSIPDLVAPTLTGFDFSPKSVDVTSGPASVSCQFSAHDSISGVSGAACAFVSSSGGPATACWGALTSGTVHDGTWSCSAIIGQGSAPGVWWVRDVLLNDAAQNYRDYLPADLVQLGFPTQLRVCSDHLGRDTDADGWGDDCDNCPSAYNPNQIDGDADQFGNGCDDCPNDFDPSQTDFDHDGQGDRCDLDDGLILIYITDKDYIDWQQEAGPNAWNVYEGDLAVLRSTGAYTQQPSSNPMADRRCHLGLNYTENFYAPPPGSVQFSLVTGMAGPIEGSLGTNSAGVPRANANPCP